MDSIGSVKGKLFTLKATTGSCSEGEKRQKQKQKNTGKHFTKFDKVIQMFVSLLTEEEKEVVPGQEQ